MNNAWIFFLHIGIVGTLLLSLFRMGKTTFLAFLALLVLTMNLFVSKQIDVFGLSVTASDPLSVGYLLGLNLLQEVYGRQTAKSCIRLSFFMAFAFCALALVHIAYTPNAFDYTHEAFKVILLPGFRIFIASLTTFFIVQFFDLRFFSLIREKTKGKYFPLRLTVSLFLSEILDTVLFTFLGLWGIVACPMQAATMCLIVKLGSIFLFVPFTLFAKKIGTHEALSI